ncbi:MAG: hypothetical protein IKK29_06540 [Christensenellaceae bacterium]|nr:hypothetical protein [Christensenellaceae bacterium]
MAKNMYSLILTEEIVNEIDRLAGASGTSRSALINSILAEYVSYRTPEMRIRDMFDRMEHRLKGSGELQVMLRSSDSLFNLRSMLNYKYNPIVNYNIELYRTESNAFGEIRIGLRTQNSTLKLYLLQFYKLWARIETAYNRGAEYTVSGERFTKKLIIPIGAQITEDELSAGVAEYVTAFDRALKEFFNYLNEPNLAVKTVEQIYLSYAQKCRITL